MAPGRGWLTHLCVYMMTIGGFALDPTNSWISDNLNIVPDGRLLRNDVNNELLRTIRSISRNLRPSLEERFIKTLIENLLRSKVNEPRECEGTVFGKPCDESINSKHSRVTKEIEVTRPSVDENCNNNKGSVDFNQFCTKSESLDVINTNPEASRDVKSERVTNLYSNKSVQLQARVTESTFTTPTQTFITQGNSNAKKVYSSLYDRERKLVDVPTKTISLDVNSTKNRTVKSSSRSTSGFNFSNLKYDCTRNTKTIFTTETPMFKFTYSQSPSSEITWLERSPMKAFTYKQGTKSTEASAGTISTVTVTSFYESTYIPVLTKISVFSSEITTKTIETIYKPKVAKPVSSIPSYQKSRQSDLNSRYSETIRSSAKPTETKFNDKITRIQITKNIPTDVSLVTLPAKVVHALIKTSRTSTDGNSHTNSNSELMDVGHGGTKPDHHSSTTGRKVIRSRRTAAHHEFDPSNPALLARYATTAFSTDYLANLYTSSRRRNYLPSPTSQSSTTASSMKSVDPFNLNELGAALPSITTQPPNVFSDELGNMFTVLTKTIYLSSPTSPSTATTEDLISLDKSPTQSSDFVQNIGFYSKGNPNRKQNWFARPLTSETQMITKTSYIRPSRAQEVYDNLAFEHDHLVSETVSPPGLFYNNPPDPPGFPKNAIKPTFPTTLRKHMNPLPATATVRRRAVAHTPRPRRVSAHTYYEVPAEILNGRLPKDLPQHLSQFQRDRINKRRAQRESQKKMVYNRNFVMDWNKEHKDDRFDPPPPPPSAGQAGYINYDNVMNRSLASIFSESNKDWYDIFSNIPYRLHRNSMKYGIRAAQENLFEEMVFKRASGDPAQLEKGSLSNVIGKFSHPAETYKNTLKKIIKIQKLYGLYPGALSMGVVDPYDFDLELPRSAMLDLAEQAKEDGHKAEAYAWATFLFLRQAYELASPNPDNHDQTVGLLSTLKRYTKSGGRNYSSYSRLCQEEVIKKDFWPRCATTTLNFNPFFYLSPLKFEIYYTKPSVVLLYDIIDRQRSQDLLAAVQRSEASQQTLGSTIFSFPEGFVDVTDRLNGLTKGALQNSDLQVERTTVGEEFSISPELQKPKEAATDSKKSNHFIVFLEAPVMGGNVVFPNLNISVSPSDGSALFVQLEGLPLTKEDPAYHHSCPSIIGHTWTITPRRQHHSRHHHTYPLKIKVKVQDTEIIVEALRDLALTYFSL